MIRESKVVVVALVVAVVVMIAMLATDEILWQLAPTHAYSVIGFIVVDLVLIIWIASRPLQGVTLTLLWTSLQLVSMILDPLTATLTDPLTGDLYFGGYTVEEAFTYLYSQQAYYTFDILLIVLIATIPLSVLARRELKAKS